MNEEIAAKYIHAKTRSHYLELKPDGTYFLFQGFSSVTGTYEVNGTELTIMGGDGASRATIANGVIVDSEGDRWVRGTETAEAVGPQRVRPVRSDEDRLESITWIPAVFRRLDFPWELVDAVAAIVLVVFLWMLALNQKP